MESTSLRIMRLSALLMQEPHLNERNACALALWGEGEKKRVDIFGQRGYT